MGNSRKSSRILGDRDSACVEVINEAILAIGRWWTPQEGGKPCAGINRKVVEGRSVGRPGRTVGEQPGALAVGRAARAPSVKSLPENLSWFVNSATTWVAAMRIKPVMQRSLSFLHIISIILPIILHIIKYHKYQSVSINQTGGSLRGGPFFIKDFTKRSGSAVCGKSTPER